MHEDPDSFVDHKEISSLKNEWSLLVHSFIESTDDEKNNLSQKILNSNLTIEEIGFHKKSLSENRKILHQKIEKIKLEIDRLNIVMENLELVRSDNHSILDQIDEMNAAGETLSSEILSIEKKLKKIREIETLVTNNLNS